MMNSRCVHLKMVAISCVLIMTFVAISCFSPLMIATRHSNTEEVRVLLQSGKVDVNEQGKWGATPLMYAVGRVVPRKCRQGIRSMCKMECKTVPDKNLEIVNLLLDAGADVHAKDIKGWTVLQWAIWGGNPGIVRRILEEGVPVQHNSRRGITLLMETMLYAGKRAKMYVRHAKRDENGRIDYDKIINLLVNTRYGRIARILIEKGVDPFAEDDGGLNAFEYFRAGSGERYISPDFSLGRLSSSVYESEGWGRIKNAVRVLLTAPVSKR